MQKNLTKCEMSHAGLSYLNEVSLSTFVHYISFVSKTFVQVQTADNNKCNWPRVIALRWGLYTFVWWRLVKSPPLVKLNDQLQFGRCEIRHYKHKSKQTDQEMLTDKWPLCEGSKKHIKLCCSSRETRPHSYHRCRKPPAKWRAQHLTP